MSTTRPRRHRISLGKATVADRIIGGLADFRTALKAKEPINRRFTVRTVVLDLEPGAYAPTSIQSMRQKLDVSQAVFARIMGVSSHTVQAWEQGKREPSRTVRRLMDDIQDDPQRWVRRLKLVAERKPMRA